MTARKPEFEHFRLIAESTYDWESWLSPEGRLRWVNPALARLTGYSVSEAFLERDYPMCWVVDADRERVFGAHEGARRGGSGNDLEFRLLTKSGEIRWFAMSWQPMETAEGIRLGFRTSIRDIQERKIAEEKLVEATIVAEQAARAKENFLAAMSHELRTPLQCIVGYSELAEETIKGENERRYLRTIREQSGELLRQISGILDLASARFPGAGSESVRLLKEATRVRDEIQGVVSFAETLVHGREIELTAEFQGEIPDVLVFEKQRFRQVLLNLLGNALKFTSSGFVRVRVSLEGSFAGTRRLAVRVEDTGPGVAEDFRPRLFEPFAQADAGTKRRFGGSGLGLYISRKLAEELGGTLELESSDRRGSCFRFEIPVEVAETERAPEAPESSSDRVTGEESRASGAADLGLSRRPGAGNADQLSIVVVDDSRIVLDLLGELLDRLGYGARLFSVGEVALSFVAEQPPDLVFVDLHMPKLDGVAFVKELRKMNLERVPLVVGMSANPYSRAMAFGEGELMDDFVTKPIGLGRLGEVLRWAAERCAANEASPGRSRIPAIELDERLISELVEVKNELGQSLLERMLPRIRGELEELLVALAASSGDEAETTSLLHRIKGHCLFFGMRGAARLCETYRGEAPELRCLREKIEASLAALITSSGERLGDSR